MSEKHLGLASRRSFLRAGAVAVVSFSFLPLAPHAKAEILGDGPQSDTPPKTTDSHVVDAFLSIDGDGGMTLFTGKVNLGTGNTTALAQMVAEELNFPLDRVTVVQGDTARTVDQGPTNGSMSIQQAGIQLRRAAATLAQACRALAAKQFQTTTDQVILSDGQALVKANPELTIPLHTLFLDADQDAEIQLDPQAPLKNPAQYKVVGKPVKRVDVAEKVFATFTFMQDLRVPDMVHARVIHPASYGAQLVSYDDTSAHQITGFLRTVRIGNLLAVIASSEWSAICASKAVDVRWSDWAELPREADLYQAVRALPLHDQGTLVARGDVDNALASAKVTVKASYYWPFQTHGSIGPSCAIADFQDGTLTVWSSTQAPHMTRDQIAAMMDMAKDKVRLIYVAGAGCYGRNGHEDAAAEAALLAREVGRPVRLQWMRADEHGWDPKGAPVVSDMEGAVGPNGQLIAWKYVSWVPYRTSGTADVPLLAGELMRSSTMVSEPNNAGGMESNITAPYATPNMTVRVNRTATTPLRPAWLRGPGRVQHTFANECFIDELAVAANSDPVAFRLNHFADPRAHAVMNAAATKANWQHKVLGSVKPSTRLAKGRGVALVLYQPNHAYVASVIDITVDRETGVIAIDRVVIAHDSGLIINPDGVRNQVEGEIVQTISRTLFEEVNFSQSAVTSVDWLTYRLLKFPELPTEVDVILIDRPDQPPVGAGEPTCAVIAPAIAGAVFDAIGVRPRAIPFTPERILGLMRA